MSKPPAFQFYPADFLVGTASMSNEEVGIYIRLLSYQWERGGLPSEDKPLRALAHSRKQVPEIVLAKFERGDDGILRNARMEKERNKQIAFRESRKVNGSLGGKAKAKSKHNGSTCYEDATNSLELNPKQNVALCLQSSSSSSDNESTHIARVRFAIPGSEAEAVEWAARAGVPPDFAKTLYHQCEGRGWVDGAGNEIQMWSSYAKGRLLKEGFNKPPAMTTRPPEKAPTIFALKAQKEAKEELAKQIKNRFCSDVAMGESWSDQEQHKKYRTLQKEIKQITERMASCH